MKKVAQATLCGGGTKLATIDELRKIRTPRGTQTWKPVPHSSIPLTLEKLVDRKGWLFADENGQRYQFSVSPDGSKMFGVTKLVIPGVDIDDEFQIAIGFRNSHDKTLALRVAVGASVGVCDNLMITGDIQVRRIHTRHISPLEAMKEAFKRIPEAAQRLTRWFGGLREMPITQDSGVALLADCVEREALPISDFMKARTSFLRAHAGNNPEINHGNTIWGVYQSVTAQYKAHALDRTQVYSQNLNQLISARTGAHLN